MVGWRRPPDPPADEHQLERNIRLLIMEIAWYGILTGTTLNFLQVYVVRLGASSLLLSAATYGPALVAMFWQLPGTQLMTRSGRRMRWVLGTGLLHRGGYLLVALAPLALREDRAEITVLLLVLLALATALSSTSFSSMLADSVPADRISQLIGWRLAAHGVAMTVSTLGCRVILQWLPFPQSFQLMFVTGFVASMVGLWHLAQVHVADRPAEMPERRRWGPKLRRISAYPGFGRFVASAFVLQMCVGMVTPLIPLFWVRRLQASDPAISLIVTATSAASVIGALFMRRVISRIGRERAVTIVACGYAFYPLLTAFTTRVWQVLPWAVLGGFFSTMMTIALFDNLVTVTPADDRTNYIAVYNILIYLSLVIGPLLAGFLARDNTGQLGLIIAAGIGFVAAVLFGSHPRPVETRA